MFTFEEFQQYIRDNILDHLPEEYKNATVTIQNVIKNNGTGYTGLVIQKEQAGISPNISLDSAYGAYRDGVRLSDIISGLAQLEIEERKHIDAFEHLVTKIQDFSYAKDRIQIKAVNFQKNLKLLQEVPYVKMYDLALICYLPVDPGPDSGFKASMTVKTDMLTSWGISAEDLFETAKANSNRINPSNFFAMQSMIKKMMHEQKIEEPELQELDLESNSEGMIIITNLTKFNGAAAIFYDDTLLKRVADKIGGDMYILPSSIHEVIALSADNFDEEFFLAMVKRINTEAVLPEEVLSENIYRYYAKTCVLKPVLNEEKLQTMQHSNQHHH